MPQQPLWVREKESGQAFRMHSVDAAEGLAMGDYELIVEPDKDLSPEERASATAGMRSTGAVTHPELQTPEQRAETRRLAAEQKAMFPDVPPGTQVVVMAGEPSEAGQPQRTSRSTAESSTRASRQASGGSASEERRT